MLQTAYPQPLLHKVHEGCSGVLSISAPGNCQLHICSHASPWTCRAELSSSVRGGREGQPVNRGRRRLHLIARSGRQTAEVFRAPVGSTLRQHSSPDGQWLVRPMRPEELLRIASIQAECFYEQKPLGPINDLLFYIFKGEVLSGLQQKLKYMDRDGFNCLVAESRQTGELVGVVEVSLQADKRELEVFQKQGLEELCYGYVACMAVEPSHRRRGVASALLKAAEIQAGKWNQNFALLHVYNGNSAAIDLYRSCGFEELKRDPEWQQLLGRRQRILFAKGATAASSGSALQSISNSVMRIFQQTSQ